MQLEQQVYKLSIPKPCHQNWDKMPNIGNGKHCNFCKKDVIDFTNWTNDAIQDYVIANKRSEICGRFKTKQLETIRIIFPHYIFQKKMPFWKHFLVLLFICFGTNFLGIHTEFGKSTSLNAQTIKLHKSNTKKKHKQKRKNKKNTQIKYYPSEILVLGGIGYQPEVKKEECTDDFWLNSNDTQKVSTLPEYAFPTEEPPADQRKTDEHTTLMLPPTYSSKRKMVKP